MLAKIEAKKVIEQLPDEATFDDAIYALYVRMNLEMGEKDIQNGNFKSTKQAEEILLRWQK